MSAQIRPKNSFLCDRSKDSEEVNQEFEALLDYLKHNHKCDLTGYKRSTLMRRFHQRMQSIKIDSYSSYLGYLQTHGEEYLVILEYVLINVTSFFRDRDTWEYLATEIVPTIIANKQPDEQIKVWSAGCASGQEVYSLLILLAEALGIESCLQRVRCFATDADKAAIWQARQGIYSELEVASIPTELRDKYFEKTINGYVFHSKLRQKVVFAYHDLTQDAPMSKIDLLVCRNVMIYFNLNMQNSILARFHIALKDNGFLFLGKTEAVINRRQIFKPISLKHHIYTKGANLEVKDYSLINPRYREKPALEAKLQQNNICQAAYESHPFAQLIVNINGCLIAVNKQANTLFGLTLKDLYRPFAELEVAKLLDNSVAHRAFYRDRRPLTLKNMQWKVARSTKFLDILITPVLNQTKSMLGVNLTFIAASDRQQVEQEEFAGAPLLK
ncbi:CheR family methyltransferase [Aliterella atlantica]|uniref:CheR family methyltransferase n=1 Tax=Aliterella atlantica TaxID=1827278 RepID=UPI00090824A2|nr:protein-glutamate O-methyltransferase CheR [Aliterella atlantica]